MTEEMVTNLAAYRFVELTELKELREELLALCKDSGLRGTILLSVEGINLFVAGSKAAVDGLMARLRKIPGLEDFEGKVSESEDQPFRRMLVRIKKEIISFGVEGVEPRRKTSPKLQAKELKKWLDEGRKITLLDTRNDYEVKLGTFKGAIVPDIHTFREFPKAVRELPDEMKEETVVMFCTGGIRCEKAGPFMEMEGFKNIYQLDGGILKYFEECGGDHYDGECFVFDQRVGVDPALKETDSAVCYACQAPLDAEDQEDVRYVAGKICPYCFKSEPEKMLERIHEAQAKLDEVCEVLPGSTPRENRRPVNVSAKYDKWTLGDVLVDQFPQIPREEWEQRCAAGRFISYGGKVRGMDHIVRAGERILQIFPPAIEPDVARNIRIIYDDEAFVMVEKPAPLPMHASGRYHRNTLQYLMNQVYEPKFLRPVHRLDANTAGLVLFARTRHFCRLLQRQFIEGKVDKIYRVRIQGHPEWDEKICEAAISSEPAGPGGRIIDDEDGLEARTDFSVKERCEDGTSLLEAKLGSGRTNQIRVHLWELGFPVVGDPCYLSGGKMGDKQTLEVGDPPLELEAWKLAFTHPITGQRMAFEHKA
ncbi:sulfurtransferase [Luteolibacter algae]|uniref:tRNA uridine(34) hydroxylase n=1 Tax=Luteolibacter algae TaxID=454151 RepID=A0ABW5D4H2_9BACT